MTFIPQKTEKYCFISCSEDKIKLGQCSCVNNKQKKYNFIKTLELKLKKKVIIVDTNTPIEAIEIDDYEFLCKGSELTEEIASELCHNIGNSITIIGNAYLDNVNDLYFWEYATDAFITSVECKDFYWLKNPYKKEAKKWKEAEEKTFKNPLIFIKK